MSNVWDSARCRIKGASDRYAVTDSVSVAGSATDRNSDEVNVTAEELIERRDRYPATDIISVAGLATDMEKFATDTISVAD